MSALYSLNTPAAVIDVPRLQRNVARMQNRMDAMRVRFRPHIKTSKSQPVMAMQLAAGARGVTVSTLLEAERFFDTGVGDILYAVGMVASKLPQAMALRRRGCDLKIITDSVASAEAIVRFGKEHDVRFEVWIEIDSDDHRSGIKPECETLLEVGHHLHQGGMHLGGVLTHAGSSYELDDPAELIAIAEQERKACVEAAERLRAAGLPCATVSVGSTPTALSALSFDGVTEVRAGVYVFFDLVMHNIGVCEMDEIALSVLTTVIGHQHEKGWAIVDAGWMAMSRDRGTQKQKNDFGYGQVCDVHGTPIPGYVISGANQEHGILSLRDGVDGDIAIRFPIGTQLRILPNHACATGAQYPEYHALGGDGAIERWPRLHGW